MRIKKKIQEDHAILIAENFLKDNPSKGFTFKFAGIKTNSINQDQYIIIFDVFSPRGSLIDGPLVVIVDKITGIASSIEN